tara:strand:- start:46 stop:150 length:105 start_codon:yes stop_codon:yes gene_type:complete
MSDYMILYDGVNVEWLIAYDTKTGEKVIIFVEED